jgi:glycosyltransferase involved in cell wall biosynthesis
MRICVFTHTFLPLIGGQEEAVDRLARQFLVAGHEVAVLAQHARRRGTPDHPDLPYPVFRYEKPFSQIWGISGLRRALARTYRSWPFDIIHTHSTYMTGYACLRPVLGHELPFVVTSHGDDLAEDSRFSDRPAIMRRIAETLRRASAVTAISAYMQERALTVAPECAARLRTIPNGVDCAELAKPVKLEDARLEGVDAPFILFLGRHDRRKGIDVLINAFELAAPRMPDIRLVIAGDGPERSDLGARARESAAAGRITFVGFVRGASKLWLLQNALILAAPTRTWEGMPLVVLEALACGRPIVGSRVGGIVDLVDDGGNGLLTRPDDPATLAEAMVRLATDPTLAAGMSARSVKKAREFEWKAVSARYLELFDSILGAGA